MVQNLYEELQWEIDKVIKLRGNTYKRIKVQDLITKILEIYYSVFTAILSVVGVKIGESYLTIPAACFTVTVAIMVCFFNSQGFARRAHDLEANLTDLNVLRKEVELNKKEIAENEYTKYYQKFYKKQGDSEYPALIDELKESDLKIIWYLIVIIVGVLFFIVMITPVIYTCEIMLIYLKEKTDMLVALKEVININSNFVAAVIGGLFTLIVSMLSWKKESKSQEKHAASMLYNDLMSIEKYLRDERSAVNIRYSEKWQSMTSACTFLKTKDVETIYEIYDLVYNYNYMYKLEEKRGSVTKENVDQYNDLKKIFFVNKKGWIDMSDYNDNYKRIRGNLERHMGK